MKRIGKARTAVSGTLNKVDPIVQRTFNAMGGDRRIARRCPASSRLNRNGDLTVAARWSNDVKESGLLWGGAKMISARRLLCSSACAVALILVSVSFPDPLLAQEFSGTLRLNVSDGATGQPVPVRVEIQGADDAYYVAEDALPASGDCSMGDPGSGPVDQAASVPAFFDRVRISNPYTDTTQFYSTGTSTVRLPAGAATIKVAKGFEYRVHVEKIEIPDGATIELPIALTRWTDMSQQGWYSADDHLHIPRPSPDSNPGLSKMLQAEDINVGNLLQMGKVTNFDIAKQYAHGPGGLYQEGKYILAAGQENPRTHFLGHTITLGAASAHFNREKYLIYRLLWEQTVKEGAINGYAHLIAPSGFLLEPRDGMSLVLPHNLMHFVEVLQFNRTGYETWYDLLALGFRLTATAGSDYPCGGQTLPGHERFYTKVDGPLTYPKWIDGVRQGRAFVTSGPTVEFRVNGQDIGSEIVLDDASTVRLTGSVAFDPERDAVDAVELVQNGEVVNRFSRVKGESKIEFSIERRVDESSWFAVRGYGIRFDENTFVKPIIFSSFESTSNVHTSPIYVSLRSRPGIEKSAHAKAVARSYLARLNDMERLLAEDNIEVLAARLADPTMDSVPKDVFLDNRQDLLDEIRFARQFFESIAQ